MRRRDFLIGGATAAGATLLGSKYARAASAGAAAPDAQAAAPKKFTAHDTVTLGKTGIKTSRLAMGTGTIGAGKQSNQTRTGMKAFSGLLLNGYDNGLRFFDAADSYGSHPYVAEALKHIPRDKVTVLTKTDNRDPAGVFPDLDRFRRELGTDYIDIVLIHCVTEGDWTERYKGVMDQLSEAKHKGIIRAHGVSCHSIDALRAAARSPWVDLDLVRINPVGAHMDADPNTVIGVIREMKESGKAVVGMKILGQGAMRTRQDEALKYALSLGLLDAFTIGAENKQEQEDLMQRIAAA